MSSTLKKTLTPAQLWSIIVGMVISGNYYGWSYGFRSTSPLGFAMAILLVTIFYTCFMFSYAELSAAIPNAGGTTTYANMALGPFAGFIAGFSAIIEYILAVPAIALAVGTYINFLFPAIPIIPTSLFSYAFFIFVNCLGMKIAAKLELITTLVAVSGVLLYIILGAPHINISNIISKSPFTGGIGGIFAAIPFAIWFYLGCEGGAMAAEECKNPRRDILRGFSIGIITLVVLAFSNLFITAGLGNTSTISNVDSPLPTALSTVFGQNSVLPAIISFVGLFGLVASLQGIIYGYSRQVFTMARSKFLPSFLSVVTKKTHTPVWALIVPSIVGFLFILTGTMAQIITISTFGAVIFYIISLVSVLILRKKRPDIARPYKVNYPLVPAISLVIALVLLIALAITNMSILFWLVLIYIGAAIYYKIITTRNHNNN